MKVMITGANGFLGQHLCRSLCETHEVVATGKGVCRVPFSALSYLQADITDASFFSRVARQVQPDVIIHAAALSKPDECHIHHELCDRVNIGGTQNVVAAATMIGKPVHLIYLSTDFIFGEGGPHREEDHPAPLNYYGHSKWMAEQVVQQYASLYTIVRPVFIYGEIWPGVRPTFLHWVKQNLEAGKTINVVSDQVRTPTYVNDICKGIQTIVSRKAGGIYHLAGEDHLSPNDMALALAKLMGADASLIRPVTAETFPEPVHRAHKGGLLIDKAMRELDYRPLHFDDALRIVFGRHTA